LTSEHQIRAAPFGSWNVAGLQLVGHDQVGLGIADKVFDDPFRVGVAALTKIGAETEVAGEADVLRGRHHQPGDHAALEAAHPVQ
jgi:hypothetical protein